MACCVVSGGRKEPGLMGKSSGETDLSLRPGRVFTRLEKMDRSRQQRVPSLDMLGQRHRPLGEAIVGELSRR